MMWTRTPKSFQNYVTINCNNFLHILRFCRFVLNSMPFCTDCFSLPTSLSLFFFFSFKVSHISFLILHFLNKKINCSLFSVCPYYFPPHCWGFIFIWDGMVGVQVLFFFLLALLLASANAARTPLNSPAPLLSRSLRLKVWKGGVKASLELWKQYWFWLTVIKNME